MASRSRRSSGRGGSGGGLGKAIWFLAVAGLIFAFFQIPYDPGAKGIYEIAKSKSENVASWVGGVAPALESFIGDVIKGGDSAPSPNGGTGGDTSASGSQSDASAKLDTLAVAEAAGVSYNRDEWKHWNNVRDCWTVREEVLVKEAKAGSVKLLDSNGNSTTDAGTACEVVGGEWVDPYSGKTFTNPRDLDIDHMVPLNYAAQHGGQSWDANKKSQYANSLDYAGHLVAASASENRAKGDKGPSVWKPSNQGSWCGYAKDWINISSNWSLTVSSADVNALKEMLNTCNG